MKLMKKTLKLNKKQKKIVIFILVMGLITGYILYKKMSPEV